MRRHGGVRAEGRDGRRDLLHFRSFDLPDSFASLVPSLEPPKTPHEARQGRANFSADRNPAHRVHTCGPFRTLMRLIKVRSHSKLSFRGVRVSRPADVAQWQSTAFVKPRLWVRLPPSAWRGERGLRPTNPNSSARLVRFVEARPSTDEHRLRRATRSSIMRRLFVKAARRLHLDHFARQVS